MNIQEHYSLLAHNTFGLDVTAQWFMEYDSIDELHHILKRPEVIKGPLLHIGSGSNLLFLHNYPGVVLHSNIKFIEIVRHRFGTICLRVGAGVLWDDLCAYAAQNNWGGIENLSAIPGEVGAAAVQNIGAYGSEFKDVVDVVTVLRLSDGSIHQLKKGDCNYGYRDSIFKKANHEKYIVLSVDIKLDKEPIFNLSYGALRHVIIDHPNLTVQQVRDAVIQTREGKLPDPKKLGNAGSFFKNPIVTNDYYFKLLGKFHDIPSYMMPDDMVKIPAAWLIEACGWKGKRINGAGVYDHQSLVLVNYGTASAQSIGQLAKDIVASVYERFGIMLQPEVNFID